MRYWDEFWPLVLSISFLAGVAGNLVASVIWAGPAVRHLHLQNKRLEAQAERHHRERMEQARTHHAAVLAALKDHVPAQPD